MKKLKEQIQQLSFYDTLRHGSIYVVSFFAVQLISLISLPIFTRLLSPADFGVYEVFNNTVRIVSIIVVLNLSAGLYRYFFADGIAREKLVTFIYSLALLGFLCFSVLYLLSGEVFLRFINIDTSLRYLFVFAVFINLNASIFDVYCTINEYSKRISLWRIAFHLLRFAFSASICYFVYKNYYGRILGEAIGTGILVALTIALYLRKYISFRPVMPAKAEIIRYSMSFIPVSLSGFILGYFDALMINIYKGNNDAGLYSYAYKIAVIYSGITASFITANRPKLFNLLNEGKAHEVKEQMRSVMKVIVAISCLFIFFAEEGGKILALRPEFEASLHLMPVLILSYVFNDMNELYNFYFYYAKKVRFFYVSFFISAVLNVILNIFLIPTYGYEVAAYTTLVSYLFMYLATYFISKFLLKQPVPAVSTYFDFFLVIGLVMAANYYINSLGWNVLLSIGVKLAIYAVAMLYVWKNIVQRLIGKPS